jgi:DNA-binding response OmpR family regulator
MLRRACWFSPSVTSSDAANGGVPVPIISAGIDVGDRIRGLDGEADDYIG